MALNLPPWLIMKCISCILLLCVLIATVSDKTATASARYQSHDILVELAEEFLNGYLQGQKVSGEPVEKQVGRNSRFKIKVQHPDARLKLAECAKQIEVFFPYPPNNLKNISIGLRCNGTVKWRVYLQSSLSEYGQVPVTNRAVLRGEALTTEMIGIREVDVLSVRDSVIRDYQPYIGQKFTRDIKSGTPLSGRFLKLPVIVERGQYLRVSTQDALVSVGAEVVALESGHVSQRIRVKNIQSGKVFSAVVKSSHSVSVFR